MKRIGTAVAAILVLTLLGFASESLQVLSTAAQEPAAPVDGASDAALAADGEAQEEAAMARWRQPVTTRLPDPVYEITIEATYDGEEKKIQGTEVLRWRNTASVPVEDLWFHHYLNAFANNRSTFMQESGGRLRGDDFDGKRWGWIEVTAATLADGTDLKAVEEYVSPDDGNPEDRTVARYPLPRPLAPGEEIEVTLEFVSQLPTIFARTGANDDYVLAGQWYPKIAVFEDAGMRGRIEAGWNCHQFHAHSEFYADFGNYDVTLTLPDQYQGHIGATGELVEETTGDGTVTVRFVQPGVHDFAWTADPDFLLLTETFDPETDVPAELLDRVSGWLGMAEDELALTPVEITLLLQPHHRPQADKYFEATKAAIRGYGLRLGAYPYSTITVVDPAPGAGGSGGMEYPTFVTGGTIPLANFSVFRKLPTPEVVTVHEFGHQYFQGMIASNEFEESWIDEGINTFYEMEVMDDFFEPTEILGMRISSSAARRAAVLGGEFPDPIVTPSWDFYRGAYGAASYGRPGATLHQLMGVLGPETFHRAMRAFFQEWRFRHPSTEDFKASFSKAAGRDLTAFFDQALHSTRELDFAVRSVSSEKTERDKGVFWRDGERIELGDDDEAEDGKSEGGEEDNGATGDEEETYLTTARFFRYGDFIHPVTVELTFEDGEVIRETWDDDRRWHVWEVERPSRLKAARVDPDGILSLDVNRLNDGRSLESNRAPVLKLLTGLGFWVQNLLLAAGLLA